MILDAPGTPLRQADLPVAWPKAGEAIVQVEVTTLSPTDLERVAGVGLSSKTSPQDQPVRQSAPSAIESAPLSSFIPGHESVGTILALGDPPPRQFSGGELAIGDRVIWSPYVSCGECSLCRRRLPQECQSLLQYGHSALGDPPRLSGALAELIHLWPKTAIFKVPKSLPAQIAAAIPHAVALAAAAIDALIAPVNTAIVTGNSLEAKLAAAMLQKRGASVDVLDSPCAIHEADSLSLDAPEKRRNVDALLDLSGEDCVYDFALRELHPGGAASFVKPSPLPMRTQFDSRELIQKHLRLTGIHRYKPEHLATALDFTTQHAAADPNFRNLISMPRPFSEANEAIAEAVKTLPFRIAFEPDQD
jgi:threonine dehydrogenase-like Zn-dependent dehydrogenase